MHHQHQRPNIKIKSVISLRLRIAFAISTGGAGGKSNRRVRHHGHTFESVIVQRFSVKIDCFFGDAVNGTPEK